MTENTDQLIKINHEIPGYKAIPYQPLQESLIRLASIQPGLLVESIIEHRHMVVTVPAREVYVTEANDPRDIIVGVSDDQLKIIAVQPRYYWSRNEGQRITVYNPTSHFFSPPKGGLQFPHLEYLPEEVPLIPAKLKELDYEHPNVALRQLLQSLYNRSETTRQNLEELNSKYSLEYAMRFKTLSTAFDPETYTPGEDLAARFNALVDKLSPSAQKDKS
jgi:hypothetical protein